MEAWVAWCRMGPFTMLSGPLMAPSSLWWQASCQPRLCSLMPSASLCLIWARDPTTLSDGTLRYLHSDPIIKPYWCTLQASVDPCYAVYEAGARQLLKGFNCGRRDGSWHCVDLVICQGTLPFWTRRQMASVRSSVRSGKLSFGNTDIMPTLMCQAQSCC